MTTTNRIIHESLSFRRLVQLAGEHNPFHAYLLVGSSMSTLGRFARTFAAWLHCTERTTPACGVCKSCQLSFSETHPALQIVIPEGNEISIATIREIIEGVDYKAAGGLHRVFIIERADALGEEAANAFLKTLEEPPPRTVFILLTDRPHAVLPTISSRCISERVQLPSAEVIIEDFLPPAANAAATRYLALLLTNCSLELIDTLEGLPEGELGTDDDLTALISQFITTAPTECLLRSSDPFGASFRYPVGLFCWLVDWLASERDGRSALTMALKVVGVNKLLDAELTKLYKTAERDFADTYGSANRSPQLAATARRRRSRRLMTLHILLILDCLQVALRLGMAARTANGALPYGLEKRIPKLEFVANIPTAIVPTLRSIITSCRKRLFANVTERAVLIDFFSSLHSVVSLAAQPPEGGH